MQRIHPAVKRQHRPSGRTFRATLLTHLEVGDRYKQVTHNEVLGRDVTSTRVSTYCGLDASITGTTRSSTASDCAECHRAFDGK